MILKYAVKEWKSNKVMSFLCLIQAVLLFAVVIGLVSIYMIRYKKYQPVRNLMERKGFICNMTESFHIDGKNDRRDVESSEAYEKMLKRAEVYGQYEVSTFIGDDAEVREEIRQGVQYSNVIAYDDELITGFRPKMKSGKWLKEKKQAGKMLEAVILQSRNKYKTGDIVYADNNSETMLKTKIPVKIVGIIDRKSDILYQSNPSGWMDYRMIFSNMRKETEDLKKISYTQPVNLFLPEIFFVSKKNLDAVQKEYVKKEAEENLFSNYEAVLPLKKEIFGTKLSGITIVSMKEKSSEKDFFYNRNKIARISSFSFFHDLSFVKKNTWSYLMLNVSDMLPVGFGMTVFTIISFISLSTLMYQKNIKKYSIYYISGITWKKIFAVHMSYIFLILFLSLCLSSIIGYINRYLRFINGVRFGFGPLQLIACVMVMLVMLIFSAWMCFSFVLGKSPKDIL